MDPNFGYNKSDGGKKRITDGYRKRISRALKGKKFSKKRCKNISESLKGREFTEEHKKNLSKSKTGPKNHFYGKQHTEESKRQMSQSTIGQYAGEQNPMYGKSRELSPNARSVLQLDAVTGETINNFTCILDASDKTGVDNSSISKACRQKLKTAGGYKWEYLNQ